MMEGPVTAHHHNCLPELRGQGSKVHGVDTYMYGVFLLGFFLTSTQGLIKVTGEIS